jgi:hypothetical protein
MNAETSPRLALQAAKGRCGELAAALEAAQAAASRARGLVTEAEAALRRFGDLEGRVKAHRVAEVEAWTAGRGPKPSSDLPSALAAEVAARRDAAEHAETMRATHAELAAKASALEAQFREGKAAVSRAAAAVIMAEGERMAAQVLALEAEAGELRKQLIGLDWAGMGALSGRPLPTPGMAQVLRGKPANVHVIDQMPPGLSATFQAPWKAWHAALMEDTDAAGVGIGSSGCSFPDEDPGIAVPGQDKS